MVEIKHSHTSVYLFSCHINVDNGTPAFSKFCVFASPRVRRFLSYTVHINVAPYWKEGNTSFGGLCIKPRTPSIVKLSGV